MGAALVFITLGAWFAYSSLKGVGLTDVFNGKGSPLNPAGGMATAPSTTGGGGGSAGTGMEAEMDRMIALHQPYKWGGGHGSSPSVDGPWDCSGAVSQVIDFLGLLPGHRPMTSTGFMTWGKSGAGSYFTVYANPDHVFIHMEAGPHAGQDWGTTSRLPSQGGSLKWQTHTKVGFVARSPS
jgi:hypothetical protein